MHGHLTCSWRLLGWHACTQHAWLTPADVPLPCLWPRAVRLGAWIKRTFSLKPSLNAIRERRKDQRDPANRSMQVEWMR